MKSALIVTNVVGFISDFLKNDVRIFIEKGYSITCATNTFYKLDNTDEFIKNNNIKVIHIDFPVRNIDLKKIISASQQLRTELNAHKYDVVHCHTPIASAITRQCTKKYKKHGMKVIYTSHGFPFYKGNNEKKAKLFYIIEKYFSKYTDAILTICNEDYNNAKHMKCPNVYLMHGVGVNINKFIKTNVDRKKYRSKLGLIESDKAILSIGELNTNKNHQVVIRAIGELKNSDLVYIICGREVTEKGKKQELTELAKSLNVRLVFLGFRKDIPEICHSVDIGVLPSLKEGLGLAGIEMLAAGIPVVGSNRQGIKDYIKDGVTGYLANPEDFYSFVDAIKNTFELSKQEKTKENCVSMTKKFDIEQAYNVILKAYNTVGI